MSENNGLVLDTMMESFVFPFMVAFILGLGVLGTVAEVDKFCELLAYVVIGLPLGIWAAYARYLMYYYWEDEEE